MSFLKVNTKAQLESQLFGDVLVEDFVDSYNNLTIKTMMMVKFIVANNIKAKFVVKVSLLYA